LKGRGLVPVVNSIRLARGRELGDALSRGGHAQIDLVVSFRVVPIKGFARDGNLDVALPTQRAPKEIAEARGFQQLRPPDFRMPQ
jgi:hypothetical protein